MSHPARAEGLSGRHRFTARGSFGPILGSARKLRGPTVVIHSMPGTPGISRLGVALTRRLVPSAVERNRVKRLVREAFRRHPLKHAGIDCVVALRRRIDAGSGAAIRAEVTRLLDELHAAESR